MLKVIQHNLNRDRLASHQLSDACSAHKTDFVLIQEPLVIQNKVYAFERCRRTLISKDKDAAIVVLTKCFRSITLNAYTSKHSVKVTYGPGRRDYVVLVSSYFKYNVPTIEHVERLSQILATESRTVICADTNGHSKLWHSSSRNRRGRIVEEVIESQGLLVHNTTGQLETFCRRDGRLSNIDVTLSTKAIGPMIVGWSVYDLTDSNHRVIKFELATNRQMVNNAPKHTRYQTKLANWDLFRSCLAGEIGGISESSINSMAQSIDRVLKTAADRAIPKRKSDDRTPKNACWSPILTNLRKTLIRERRQGLRRTDRAKYNRLRNEFLSEIRKHKLSAWKCFAEDLNANPWSKAFKWAKNGSRGGPIACTLTKVNGTQTTDCNETAELILNSFVPPDPLPNEITFDGPLNIVPLPDQDLIKTAIWRYNVGHSP